MPSLDSPTHVDEFGFTPYVKGIADLIMGLHADELPAAVGVYGAWGSGKTSFMCQLDTVLKGKGGTASVWFQAWKYDRMDDVRSALVFKILSELKRQDEDSVQQKASNVMAKAAEFALAFASRVSVSGVGVSLPSWKELAEESETKLNAIDAFSQEFTEVVGAYLDASHVDRLVVFVDDLDRCLPDNIILVLEALKLFLESAKCVFVIGLDRSVVEAAVETRYGAGLASFGREYVDKLIRYPFEIPGLRLQDLRQRYSALTSSSGLDEHDWFMVQEAARSNPRSFLRILSEWAVIRTLAESFSIDINNDEQRRLLLFVVCAHVCYPRLFEACGNRPDRIETFGNYCHNAPTDGALTLLDANGAEFKPLWEDPRIRYFMNACWAQFEQMFRLPTDVKARAFKLMASSA